MKDLDFLLPKHPTGCSCGRNHTLTLDDVILGAGALRRVPEVVLRYGKRPFLLADGNTWRAAGEQVAALLTEAGITYGRYLLPEERTEPDEKAVGGVMMGYDPTCDVILGVGSGVVNDIGKLLSHVAGRPYIIVATAPSMDGYASATSSMAVRGAKVSLPSRGASVILGDTDVLKAAPMEMLRAGFGDMLAKYTSICEWRLAQTIVGEYYCEEVADQVRSALRLCVEGAPGLLERDPEAVEHVFRGLVLSGIAMNYAGLSRPASGGEHYMSHLWDMRGLAFDLPVSLHGLQCAVGTYQSARVYDRILPLKPDWEKAEALAESFSYDAWAEELRTFLGAGAEPLIALEKKEGKYDPSRQKARLRVIREKWQEILAIIREEMPREETLSELYDLLGMPKTPEEVGVENRLLPITLRAAGDIRDKYVFSRLLWDLGLRERFAEKLAIE